MSGEPRGGGAAYAAPGMVPVLNDGYRVLPGDRFDFGCCQS